MRRIRIQKNYQFPTIICSKLRECTTKDSRIEYSFRGIVGYGIILVSVEFNYFYNHYYP